MEAINVYKCQIGIGVGYGLSTVLAEWDAGMLQLDYIGMFQLLAGHRRTLLMALCQLLNTYCTHTHTLQENGRLYEILHDLQLAILVSLVLKNLKPRQVTISLLVA